MDLKGVRAFCSVADGGGFSRAAATLGVAQSVLSRQVSALEATIRASGCACTRPTAARSRRGSPTA